MQVLSQGGLPVSSVVWQSSAGAWALTAVCKVTFRLEPGTSPVADEQEPVNEDDNHWNDDDTRSLVAPSDLAPFKPRADVVIVGHAFAPERRPVRSLVVRVCVGEVDKSVEVFCDRAFEPDGRVREGSPFVKMPLRYERASGGADLWNPVGVSFDAPPDAYGRTAIGNLQPLGTFVQWKGDRFDAIGLGPIAPTWPGRLEKLYRHARLWSHRDWHARPLPADISLAYFNVAPSDQQTDAIHSNERLMLENLHPVHARLVTSLPDLAPRALVERASGHRQEMELVGDTLWIDTDRAICTVTWRGRIGLVHPREEGVVRMGVEGLDLRGGGVPELAADSMVEVAGGGRAGGAVGAAATATATVDDGTATLVPGLGAAARGDATATLAPGLQAVSRAALPFEKSPWRVSPLAAPGADRAARAEDEEAGATMFLVPSGAVGEETLPFARPPAPQSAQVTAAGPPAPPAMMPLSPALSSPVAHRAPHDVEPDHTENAPLVPMGAADASPPWEALRGRESFSLVGGGTANERAVSDLAVQAGPTREAPGHEAPVPPAMIGPLARVGTEIVPADDGSKPKEIEAAPSPPPAAKVVLPPAERELDLELYTIEHCARMTVSMACRPADTAKILEENELSEKRWTRVKNHWLEAIRQELGKGKNTLLKRYDVAYVAQVEVERGPIGMEGYARLSVAAERGRLGEAVAEMGLPSGAPIRIERVWMERMARDAAFGAKVRAAVEEGRAA